MDLPTLIEHEPYRSNLIFQATTPPPETRAILGAGWWQFSLIIVLSRYERLTRPRYLSVALRAYFWLEYPYPLSL